MNSYPADWTPTFLGALASYINGRAFGPGDWGAHGLPIIRIEQLLNPNAEADHFSGVLDPANRIDTGDLVFSWSATLAVRRWDRGPAALNQHLFKVIPKAGVNDRFLHHLIEFHIEDLAGQSHGSTMRHIKRGDLADFQVCIPSEAEQVRIAEVLDTLDEAIRRSEDVRGKRRQLLEGLAQQLMTCGVDEDGQIRDASQAPNDFEQTLLGRFPRSWQVKSIGDLGTTITGSTPPSSVPGVWGNGLPFVTPSEVTEGGSVLSASRFVTSKGKAYVSPVPPGTILTVCIGSLGKMGLAREECATNQQINATIPGPGVNGTFLEYAIRLQMRKLWALAGLQVLPIVNRTQFEGLKVAIAPPEEQCRIGDIIRAQRSLIQEEELVLDRLQALKLGLTSDLLTGRVRVPVGA